MFSILNIRNKEYTSFSYVPVKFTEVSYVHGHSGNCSTKQ